MAKWGEGDSRWIVDERRDGTNINGWHWEVRPRRAALGSRVERALTTNERRRRRQERNMMKWSRERIESLLVGVDLDVPVSEGRATVTELSKFEGDSSVSTRKGGKKVGCFDLSVTAKWRGVVGVAADSTEDEDEVKGEIVVKEFCSTNDEDEYDFAVSAKDGKSESKALLKSRVEKSVEAILLPKLRQFCEELKEM
jgi:activator of HSP90 ATPase